MFILKPPLDTKIPTCYFSCTTDWCAENRSYLASELFWIDKYQGWYCFACICDMPEDAIEGISLEDWLQEIKIT